MIQLDITTYFNHYYVIVVLFIIFLYPLNTFGQIDIIAEDKFTFEVEGARVSSRYYTTHSLSIDHSDITKLIVVIHGTNRNADDYFDNMKSALRQRPEQISSTAIIAPQYLTEDDIDFHRLSDDHLYWSSDGWKSGSNSRNESSNPREIRVPSFEVQDTLIMRALQSFPNLSHLIFTGHSAGGQFTNRYTACSPIFNILCDDYNISSKSIIANPGTYVYMSPERRVGDSETEFAIPNVSCSDYNEWSFGLEDLFVYPSRAGADQIKEWYSSREIVYLLGQNDNDPDASTLPRSCRAMTMGDHRYERGRVYYNHIIQTFGEEIKSLHTKVEVPNVGHSNFDMYHSEEGLKVLFDEAPLQACNPTTAIDEVITVPFKVFPNPTKSIFSFELNSNLNDAQINILNMKGQLLLSDEIHKGEIEISSFETGVYWIRLKTEGKIYISKVVKI